MLVSGFFTAKYRDNQRYATGIIICMFFHHLTN